MILSHRGRAVKTSRYDHVDAEAPAEAEDVRPYSLDDQVWFEAFDWAYNLGTDMPHEIPHSHAWLDGFAAGLEQQGADRLSAFAELEAEWALEREERRRP